MKTTPNLIFFWLTNLHKYEPGGTLPLDIRIYYWTETPQKTIDVLFGLDDFTKSYGYVFEYFRGNQWVKTLQTQEIKSAMLQVVFTVNCTFKGRTY